MAPVFHREVVASLGKMLARSPRLIQVVAEPRQVGKTTAALEVARRWKGPVRYAAADEFYPPSLAWLRSKCGIPKLIVWNNALVSAMDPRPSTVVRQDPSAWGRLVENAVGAHLLNLLPPTTHRIRYWRHRNLEVDFVVSTGSCLFAIEVKSGPRDRASGLDAFLRLHPRARPLVVGPGGLALDDFFRRHPAEILT